MLAQVLSFVPDRHFRHLVAKYQGDYKVSTFSCWDQFVCRAFAQVTYRESLRDIGMPALPDSGLVSLGPAGSGVAQHPGRRQRAARLAH